MANNLNTNGGKKKPGLQPRDCGCKGIRSCRFCENHSDIVPDVDVIKSDPNPSNAIGDGFGFGTTTTTKNPDIMILKNTLQYCICCKRLWELKPSIEVNQKETNSSFSSQRDFPGDNANIACTQLESQIEKINDTAQETDDICDTKKMLSLDVEELHRCFHENQVSVPDFDGVEIIENFVTEAEEISLDKTICETVFVKSQSGRRKQDFGPKVNFKKQKVRTANFTGLPSYSQILYERMKQHKALSDFEPVELCNLEYCPERGAHIDPHFDDAWLWGERLVTLNLLSDSTLTFTTDSESNLEIRVPLLRRSLLVVKSAARHKWKHSIHVGDISERRIAMTFRELSSEFSSGGQREKDGVDLLKLALTFQGCAIGS